MKYRASRNAEQLLSLCCGKQKDGEAIKELGGREGGFWFFSFRSIVLEQESLTLTHSNLIISVIGCITDV